MRSWCKHTAGIATSVCYLSMLTTMLGFTGCSSQVQLRKEESTTADANIQNTAFMPEAAGVTGSISQNGHYDITGQGLYLHDSVIEIRKGGKYEISGVYDGNKIRITCSEPVELVLNNAAIFSEDSAAIENENGAALSLVAAPDTENLLQDNENLEKHLICSTGKLRFSGEGKLKLKTNSETAVYSNTDIHVENGIFQVLASDGTAFAADGEIIVDGGAVYISESVRGLNASDLVMNNGYLFVSSVESPFSLQTEMQMHGGLLCTQTAKELVKPMVNNIMQAGGILLVTVTNTEDYTAAADQAEQIDHMERMERIENDDGAASRIDAANAIQARLKQHILAGSQFSILKDDGTVILDLPMPFGFNGFFLKSPKLALDKAYYVFNESVKIAECLP